MTSTQRMITSHMTRDQREAFAAAIKAGKTNAEATTAAYAA